MPNTHNVKSYINVSSCGYHKLSKNNNYGIYYSWLKCIYKYTIILY